MSPSGQPVALSKQDAERWLSRPRLQVYLDRAEGDITLALDLYVWSSDLAAAALSDAFHLEVALRNAYDTRLSQQFPDWAVDSSSTLFTRTQGVPQAVAKQNGLNAGSARTVFEARRVLGTATTHGQVLANLSLGFWTRLTERDRTPTFWTPMIRHAYPDGTSRADVHDLVVKINRFRNRLAHNEPVFSSRTGLGNRLADVGTLFRLLDPDIAEFVSRHSTVNRTLERCPIAGLV